jgi:aerobic C4-dicarboxylate transport protein
MAGLQQGSGRIGDAYRLFLQHGGTAIYMSIGILFLAHAPNVHLTVTEQFTTLLVMLFTSKGAAGVTGGGFVALAATLPAVNLVPVGSLSLPVGVDRFMA